MIEKHWVRIFCTKTSTCWLHFTSGDPVADKLDGILKCRYYRQHWTLNLDTKTHNDLSGIFIQDNSPGAFKSHQNNAITIKFWLSDHNHTGHLMLLPLLDALTGFGDWLKLEGGRGLLTSNLRSLLTESWLLDVMGRVYIATRQSSTMCLCVYHCLSSKEWCHNYNQLFSPSRLLISTLINH